MEIKVLKTERDYEEACRRIYELIHSVDDPIEADSDEGEELELLSILVEKYEQENYSLGVPDPVEAIKFRMEQMGLRQSDIASLFGGKTRVSEVLHRKRPLTLKMIILLNRYLGIPFESLLGGRKDVSLDKEERVKLLSVAPIREYIKAGTNRSGKEESVSPPRGSLNEKNISSADGAVASFNIRRQSDLTVLGEKEKKYNTKTSLNRSTGDKRRK